jgi:hypothetical protein
MFSYSLILEYLIWYFFLQRATFLKYLFLHNILSFTFFLSFPLHSKFRVTHNYRYLHGIVKIYLYVFPLLLLNVPFALQIWLNMFIFIIKSLMMFHVIVYYKQLKQLTCLTMWLLSTIFEFVFSFPFKTLSFVLYFTAIFFTAYTASEFHFLYLPRSPAHPRIKTYT